MIFIFFSVFKKSLAWGRLRIKTYLSTDASGQQGAIFLKSRVTSTQCNPRGHSGLHTLQGPQTTQRQLGCRAAAATHKAAFPLTSLDFAFEIVHRSRFSEGVLNSSQFIPAHLRPLTFRGLLSGLPWPPSQFSSFCSGITNFKSNSGLPIFLYLCLGSDNQRSHLLHPPVH